MKNFGKIYIYIYSSRGAKEINMQERRGEFKMI